MLSTPSNQDALELERERRRRRRQQDRGVPVFRGAAAALQGATDREAVIAGPADTGKTVASLWKLDTLLRTTPKSRYALVRKVATDIESTVLGTYREVIGRSGSGAEPYGGNMPQWYDYPNGARLYLGGMDRSGRVLSSERDGIYVNQSEELSLDNWETLTTRVSGRGAVTDTPMLWGDANPGPPTHWMLHRPSLRMLYSRHEDNPALYTDDGRLTPEGVTRLGVLDALTGIRYKRLRLGLWVAAEGTVYDFDRSVHLVDEAELIVRGILHDDGTINRAKVRQVVAGVDWGLAMPGVLGVFAVDNDKRLILVHEIYRTGQRIGWWTQQAKDMRDRFGVDVFVCDPAEPAYILEFQAAGLYAIGGYNPIAHGIQAVQERMVVQADGLPRLQVSASALAERDEALADKHLPVCTVDEFDVYVYPKAADGKPLKEIPVDGYNHGCFVAGTLVETIDGPRPIEAIRPGEYVLTRAGYYPVYASGMTDPAAAVLTLALDDGRTLTGTANHPIFARDRGFVRMDTLRYTDALVDSTEYAAWNSNTYRPNDQTLNASGLMALSIAAILNQVVGLIVNIFVVAWLIGCVGFGISTGTCGHCITARSLKAGRCIIATATRSTIRQRILRHCRRWNTVLGIFRKVGSVRRLRINRQKPTENACTSEQKTGTNPKPGGSGIARMRAGCIKTFRQSRKRVNSVAKHMQFTFLEKQQRGSVRSTVKRNGDVTLALTMKRASAQPAVSRLSVIAMRKLVSAHSHVGLMRGASVKHERASGVAQPSTCGRRSESATAALHVRTLIAHTCCVPVYNLTVDAPIGEYFANGILVHNCDMTRYVVAHVDGLRDEPQKPQPHAMLPLISSVPRQERPRR